MPNPKMAAGRPVDHISGESVARYYQSSHHFDATGEYVTPTEASMHPEQGVTMVAMRRAKEADADRLESKRHAEEEAAAIDAARLEGAKSKGPRSRLQDQQDQNDALMGEMSRSMETLETEDLLHAYLATVPRASVAAFATGVLGFVVPAGTKPKAVIDVVTPAIVAAWQAIREEMAEAAEHVAVIDDEDLTQTS